MYSEDHEQLGIFFSALHAIFTNVIIVSTTIIFLTSGNLHNS